MSVKKVFLMRHSIQDRCGLPTALLPLTEDGRRLAEYKKPLFTGIDKCFTSPYKRAFDTAMIISPQKAVVIEDLHERIVGEADEDLWLKQFTDHDFKNPGGESLNIVKVRMSGAMAKVLSQMDDGETALVVSHATAISSYLLNFCEVKAIDATDKSRSIIFNGQEVLRGRLNPTEYFEIEYVDDNLTSIKFFGNDFNGAL